MKFASADRYRCNAKYATDGEVGISCLPFFDFTGTNKSLELLFRVYVAPSRSQYPRGIRFGEHPIHRFGCHAKIPRYFTVVNGLTCGSPFGYGYSQAPGFSRGLLTYLYS